MSEKIRGGETGNPRSPAPPRRAPTGPFEPLRPWGAYGTPRHTLGISPRNRTWNFGSVDRCEAISPKRSRRLGMPSRTPKDPRGHPDAATRSHAPAVSGRRAPPSALGPTGPPSLPEDLGQRPPRHASAGSGPPPTALRAPRPPGKGPRSRGEGEGHGTPHPPPRRGAGASVLAPRSLPLPPRTTRAEGLSRPSAPDRPGEGANPARIVTQRRPEGPREGAPGVRVPGLKGAVRPPPPRSGPDTSHPATRPGGAAPPREGRRNRR